MAIEIIDDDNCIKDKRTWACAVQHSMNFVVFVVAVIETHVVTVKGNYELWYHYWKTQKSEKNKGT